MVKLQRNREELKYCGVFSLSPCIICTECYNVVTWFFGWAAKKSRRKKWKKCDKGRHLRSVKRTCVLCAVAEDGKGLALFVGVPEVESRSGRWEGATSHRGRGRCHHRGDGEREREPETSGGSVKKEEERGECISNSFVFFFLSPFQSGWDDGPNTQWIPPISTTSFSPSGTPTPQCR